MLDRAIGALVLADLIALAAYVLAAQSGVLQPVQPLYAVALVVTWAVGLVWIWDQPRACKAHRRARRGGHSLARLAHESAGAHETRTARTLTQRRWSW